MTDLSDFDQAEVAEMFEYLDDLRESGETNMFGARPYVQREFGLGSNDAGAVLAAWMQTFDDTPAAARAQSALSNERKSGD